MANRQYIGARYVPKLVGEWQADTFYEALSIVTSNNVSYTSKKPVPPTVGIPAENPEYWVATGNYSAQMQQIIEEVNGLSGDVSNLSDDLGTLSGTVTTLSGTVDGIGDNVTTLSGKVETLEDEVDTLLTDGITVLVMDSYGTTYANPSGENRTVFDFVKESQYYNENNFIGKAFSGDGLISSGGTGKNFIEEMDLWLTSFADKDKIKEFHIASGRNDIAYSAANIFTAMGDMVSMLKTHCPKSKVYFEFIAISDMNSQIGVPSDLVHVFDTYTRANECGATFIGGCEAILHYGRYVALDGIHPTIAGKKALGRYLADAMHNKTVSVNTAWERVTFDSTEHKDSRVTYGANSFTPYAMINENRLVFRFNSIAALNISGGWTLSEGIESYINLGAIYNNENNPFCGITETMEVPANLTLYGVNTDNIHGKMVITPDMEVRIYVYNPGGGTTRTINKIDVQWIGGRCVQPVIV